MSDPGKTTHSDIERRKREAQRLLARLDKAEEIEAPSIQWSEDMPNGY